MMIKIWSWGTSIAAWKSKETAGALGGAAASLVRVPTEFSSAPNAVRTIVAKEGLKGLYAGCGSFLLRDLPFDAIQFCLYEQLRIGYKLAVIAERLSEEEIGGLKELFKMIDTDNSGTITLEELKSGFKMIDTDNSGTITLDVHRHPPQLCKVSFFEDLAFKRKGQDRVHDNDKTPSDCCSW